MPKAIREIAVTEDLRAIKAREALREIRGIKVRKAILAREDHRD